MVADCVRGRETCGQNQQQRVTGGGVAKEGVRGVRGAVLPSLCMLPSSPLLLPPLIFLSFSLSPSLSLSFPVEAGVKTKYVEKGLQ